MNALGLPGDAGIVIATTMSTSIYAGMIAWTTIPTLLHLTVAQATTISGMMLFAHTLPIELLVTKKAGIRKRYAFVWRVVGAFVFGYLIHAVCSTFHLLQAPAHVVFQPSQLGSSLMDWGLAQLITLGKIGAIIFGLIVMMKLFKKLRITQGIETLLRPVLSKIGISDCGIPLTIIGLVLGLVYGGALIIREANQGHMSKTDTLFSLAMLNLCHSLFEDSLLGVVMGGNFLVLVFARFAFAYVAVLALFKCVKRHPNLLTKVMIN
jgi:hypothetical protein